MNNRIAAMALAAIIGAGAGYAQKENIRNHNILIKNIPDGIEAKIEIPFAVLSGALTGISLIYAIPAEYNRRRIYRIK